MPRLENPAGTMRTSRRRKGWTPSTVLAAAKHRGNSGRSPIYKRRVKGLKKQMINIPLHALVNQIISILIQMNYIIVVQTFALRTAYFLMSRNNQGKQFLLFFKIFHHASKTIYQLRIVNDLLL